MSKPRDQQTGLEHVRGFLTGELPPSPVGVMMGWRYVAVDDGRAQLDLDPGPHLYNKDGTVHGGILATLLDATMWAAITTRLGVGVRSVTVDLKVSYVAAPGPGAGTLSAHASAISVRRTLAIAEGRLVGPDGKLYCHATGTFSVLHPRAPKAGVAHPA